MNLLRKLRVGVGDDCRRWLCLAILALVSWLACGGVGLAQPPKPSPSELAATSEKKGDQPPYLPEYILVVACVGLGMWLVCQSANRHSLTKTWTPLGLLGGRGEGEAGKKKGGSAPRTKQISKDAQTALGISIAGVVPVAGLFIAAFGMWKSIQAKKTIAENRLLTGEGIALAGIIVGAVLIVVQLVVTAVILIKALS